MLNPIILNNLSEIKKVCEKHHVKELYVFGSVVTDNFKEDSDVDFVIDFEGVEEKEFANNYFSLMEKLKEVLKRNVDFVTEKYLRNRFFIEQVNKTKIQLI